jgi:UDP-GlcNAc3NAcA epimerase
MKKPVKIITVVGARPQFIKAAAVSRAITREFAGRCHEVLVHTGQHYDESMSQIFFDELGIPAPAHHLEISGGGHGAMTGRMLQSLEVVFQKEKPDWVLIYGDTNSTLAAALAAAKLNIPVAHVEAGLRSFNMRMPEEVNRIVADRVSTLLLCPTQAALDNLRAEGMARGVHLVGDVMYDVSLHYRDLARASSQVMERLQLTEGRFALATCHRAENTDDPARLTAILGGLSEVARAFPVVLPLHPRTRKIIADRGLQDLLGGITLTEPLSFMDMVRLEQSARVVVTDSGGVQKEAYFYGVPCVTMRDQTEWTETVDLGWNTLVGADKDRIAAASLAARAPAGEQARPYGDGKAAEAVIRTLLG